MNESKEEASLEIQQRMKQENVKYVNSVACCGHFGASLVTGRVSHFD